jgi:hypothetical protein
MSFIQGVERLVERERSIQIRAIRVEPIQLPEFLDHSIKGNLKPVVAFAVHLGIAVPEYSNQPTLHRLYIAQTRPRSIGLKECFLGQLFGIRPGAGPPIGNPVEESLVLSYPSIESLIADLHCRCCSPETLLQLKSQSKADLFHSSHRNFRGDRISLKLHNMQGSVPAGKSSRNSTAAVPKPGPG